MTRIAFVVAVIFAACTGKPAQAEDFAVGSLKISAPWVRDARQMELPSAADI
jgi:hypothetical protein